MAAARSPDYSHTMINKKHFFKIKITNEVGFVLGAVLLAALTESAGYAGGVTVGIDLTPIVVVAPPVVVPAPAVVVPVVVVQDDYVYYPSYGIYYNSGRRQYAYLENGAWVLAAAPQDVSIDVLLASPSVNMDWHDSPEKHHGEMLKRYPKDWKSSDEHHDQKDDRKPGPPEGDKKH